MCEYITRASLDLTKLKSSKLDLETKNLTKHLLGVLAKLCRNLEKTTAAGTMDVLDLECLKELPTGYIWLHNLIPEDIDDREYMEYRTCMYALWDVVYGMSRLLDRIIPGTMDRKTQLLFTHLYNCVQKLLHRLRTIVVEDTRGGQSEYSTVSGMCVNPTLGCTHCGLQFEREKYLDIHTYREHY